MTFNVPPAGLLVSIIMGEENEPLVVSGFGSWDAHG